MKRSWFETALFVALVSVTACQPTRSGRVLEIQVLSNRADLLSGGDALLDIVLPEGADVSDLSVSLNGEDVSATFAVRSNGRVQGLVTGLPVGESTLAATLGGLESVRISLTNHPIGGPIFSGPQLTPYVCRTEESGFGPPIDAQCNATSKVEYFYRSTETPDSVRWGALRSYDPANPPSDVDETTTDEGLTVPFIVRREQGTLDRGFYSFAVLFDPSKRAFPWEAPAAWNGKILYGFGGGSPMGHIQSGPRRWLDDATLSRGFVQATTSLNGGSNGNTVVSAEAAVMLKEHITETLGPIRYTIGFGGSLGAVHLQVIANAYPGLLDGIAVGSSIPDLLGPVNNILDCSLLMRYFEVAAPALWEDTRHRRAAMGQSNEPPGTCETTSRAIGLSAPTLDCLPGPGGPAPERVYSADTNPGGVRCTVQDDLVAMLGKRRDGFANRPYDNVGVQYGLAAVEAEIISPEQFIDLNEEVGGWDIDAKWTSERSEADPMALEVSYRSGQLNLGHGMNTVPIIDYGGCTTNEAHPCSYSLWVMRARLASAHGSADNHVALLSEPGYDVWFDLMDRWMAAIKADTSEDAQAVKVVRNKPADAVDTCWIESERVTDWERCLEANPHFGNPSTGGGMPMGAGTLKCQLKPLDRRSYSARFTDDQWARMEAAFPGGVCDWTLPSVGYTTAVPWLSFADGPGGRPLGSVPVSMVVSN